MTEFTTALRRGAGARRPTLIALALLGAAAVLTGCTTGGGASPTAQASQFPGPMVETSSATPSPSVVTVTATPDLGTTPVAELADADWVAATAAEHGLEPRVLASYAGAALAIAPLFPQCHLGWETLAGIGAVESAHGTWDGASVGDDGQVSPAVYGPLLTGEDNQRTPDTDGGTLDGNSQWDRAVGPMQFLPATWAEFGLDGNRDGVSDPQQIDDATLTAAYYLCGFGDLSDEETWINAVYSYNPSLEYNHEVVEATNRYTKEA